MTYLHHAVPDQEDVDVEEGLRHVSRLISCIAKCNELEFNYAINSTPIDNRNELAENEDELRYLVNTLPDPERLNEILLTCEADVFLDVLMGNIRNTLIGFQAWLNKLKQAKSRVLINNLNRIFNRDTYCRRTVLHCRL